jgi:pre-mRNA-splicing factor CDC5/CEF1
MSVRVIRKGGIWKNTEDEILKAAVMKYGKNQWARIASLLSRKTAKQCKARWYEWLDPSIKKIEWSREEEEKLLHMAKIMPTQWRTIAAIVGRTAAQCLEHYEKLLDQATGKDDFDPSDDPRRLRPGEIDPNPEARPARPDQVDMEEDEKEMLQEARARLANTKGKKAKRKAREKQLEEARRLASLQKRRELKAAGITTQKHQRKRKGIDYNKEIPFLHTPSVGFYGTEEENQREKDMKANPKFRPVLLNQLEGDRRDDIERLKRQEDAKKAKAKKENDRDIKAPVEKPVRRTALNMPKAQMTDAEIAELSKVGQLADDDDDESNPTSGLTPKTNMLTATPHGMKGESVPSTPGGRHVPSTPGGRPDMTPMTPSRYALSYDVSNNNNDNDFMDDESEIGAQPTISARDIRKNILSGLASLPAPKAFQPQMPDMDDMDEIQDPTAKRSRGTSSYLSDEHDIQRANAYERQLDREAKLALRSQALKLDLPRPLAVNAAYAKDEKEIQNLEKEEDIAIELIKLEMISLLTLDAIEYPTKNIKAPSKVDPDYFLQNYEIFDTQDLDEAQALLDEETKHVIASLGEYDSEAFAEAWENSFSDLLYIPASKKFGLHAHLSDEMKISSLQHSFDNSIAETKKLQKKVQQTEKKAKLILGGYLKINGIKEKDIQVLNDRIEQLETELDVYKVLKEKEDIAIVKRLESLKIDVKSQREQEKESQQRYFALTQERDALFEQMREDGPGTDIAVETPQTV